MIVTLYVPGHGYYSAHCEILDKLLNDSHQITEADQLGYLRQLQGEIRERSGVDVSDIDSRIVLLVMLADMDSY